MSRAEQLRLGLVEAGALCSKLAADSELAGAVDAVVAELVASIRAGGKILLCGNGGSASDAQHLAAELVGRFCVEREPFPAIALSDNVAALTAIANDYGYDEVFVRALRALGRPGDVLLAISTSGRSANVVNAIEAAEQAGLVTVALIGADADTPMGAARHVLRVPGASTARTQEGQMLIGHLIFEMVERELTAP